MQLDPSSLPTGAAQTERGDPASRICVTFQLAGQTFGVEVHHVREILDRQQIMRLPNSAHDCMGVIDTRGESVPVIDLAGRFAIARAEDGAETRIIVFDLDAAQRRHRLGILVDRVLDVIRIPGTQIEPAPATAFDAPAATGVLGIARIDGDLVALLDAGHIFAERIAPRPGACA